MRQKPEESDGHMILTFQEAQELLRITHNTLYRLIETGLPSHKIGRKRVFLREDLIRWVKEH